MDSDNLCTFAVLGLCLALVAYGFMLLLQKQLHTENDIQVIQRQLRGFSFLILSQLVLVAGLAICTGFDMSSLQKMVKSVRM